MALVKEDGDQFLPHNTLKDILTRSMIQSVLLEEDETKHIQLSSIVGDEPRIKLLAILILLKKTKRLGPMIRVGLSDEMLPLSERIFFTSQGHSNFVERFMIQQSLVAVPAWDFTSHDIQVGKYTVTFHNMPFLKKTKLSNGGQGTVWKVEIHPAHFTGTRTGSVCLQIQGPMIIVRY